MNDLELLRDYLRNGSEESFGALVKRHLNLVYSAALRQVRSPELAEEVAQSVFIDLARQARGLAADTALGAWLHQVTRRAAVDVVRRESRRQLREQVAHELSTMNTPGDWTQISPLLDEAVDTLDDADRVAVVLRFFEQKSLNEIGQFLGTSEDAAQKRVARAVDRLRKFFTQHGVTVGVTGLVGLISANAVQAAPAGLFATISTAASLAGVSGAATATATAVKTIAMTTLQKAAIGTVIAACVATAVYQGHEASNLRNQNETLRQNEVPLAEQIQQLTRERDDATNQFASLMAQNDMLKSNTVEILRLRREVTRLKNEPKGSQAPQSAKSVDEGDTASLDGGSPLGRINLLKRALKQTPEKQIPETGLLTDRDWLRIASMPMVRDLDTDEGLRRALSTVREVAKENFAGRLGAAMVSYANANGGQLPSDVSQLKQYLDTQQRPFDPDAIRYGMPRSGAMPSRAYPPIDEANLQRYSITQSGNIKDLRPGQPIISENTPIDQEFDTLIKVGLKSYLIAGTGRNSGQTGWGGSEGPDFESMTPQQKEAYERSSKQMEEAKQRSLQPK